MPAATGTADAPAVASAALAKISLRRLRDLEQGLGEVIRGKPEAVRLALVCLLGRGHLLIEDVPGVGKTTLASALARSVHCDFQRLQCTSDMLPSDILGVTIYSGQKREFEFKPGPVFTHFLLADEINRATPKTQSALLEAMNERQVTVDGRSYKLSEPFMVLATQNPVEHHGTYPLPESQLDRFLMRIKIGYPDRESERVILRGASQAVPAAAREVLTTTELLQLQRQVDTVPVEDAVADYMLEIIERSRRHESFTLGVSPRGAQALFRASQALALIEGREYVIPDDVKRLAIPVCAHRVVVNTRVALSRGFEAAERTLQEILAAVEVPL